MLKSHDDREKPARNDQVSLTLNGWVRLLGMIGIPGAISLYLVWWLTQWLGAKLDRMIQLLEQIARAVNVRGL
ncbi:MAG: hypothetical protein HY726_20625 [Candidatus Rokubacteria bacterium]|nr:hypothetical protein [Candidatus Rokubacteria bacterium]